MTTTTTARVLTSDEAQTAVFVLRDTYPDIYVLLRRWASDRLSERLRDWLGEDHGQGISSSDVSCSLIDAIRFGDAPDIGPVRHAIHAAIKAHEEKV
jgi:hypothetical protein